MKLSEFKENVRKYINERVGKHAISLMHFDKSIFLQVKHPTQSSPNKEIDTVFKVYIDNVKKRIFLVGMSEDMQHGLFFKKYPVDIRFNKFVKWLNKSDNYDNHEMYFAWKYDLKDETTYDYILLDNKVEADPSPENLSSLVFSTIDDPKKFKLKVKNLHENRISISYY